MTIFSNNDIYTSKYIDELNDDLSPNAKRNLDKAIDAAHIRNKQLIRDYNSDRRIELQKEYNQALVDNGLAMSRKDLKKLNIIDIRPMVEDGTKKNDYGFPISQISRMLNSNELPDLNAYELEYAQYSLIPCFTEGVLQVNTNRYVYWKIEHMDLYKEKEIHIHIKDYVRYAEYWQPGVEGTFVIEFDGTSSEYGYPVRFKDVKELTDIFSQLDCKKDLHWTDEAARFFRNTVFLLADSTTKANENTGSTGFQSLFVLFKTIIQVVNYKIYKNKPVADRKANKSINSKIKHEYSEPSNQPKRLVRTLGSNKEIVIKSDKIPKLPSRETIVHYKVASWVAKGGVRRMKDGRLIPFKESIHYRQCMKETGDTPVTVIRVK